STDVAILVVLTKGSRMEDYRSALNSLDAYAELHGYQLLLESDDKFEECARHKDVSFTLSEYYIKTLQFQLPEDSWILFIDADVGVVNPNKLIEEFIEPEYDIYTIVSTTGSTQLSTSSRTTKEAASG
ncbi:hypothetical protein PMAYCL1PPCAC_00266, partial [Pristionchus mayeri]